MTPDQLDFLLRNYGVMRTRMIADTLDIPVRRLHRYIGELRAKGLLRKQPSCVWSQKDICTLRELYPNHTNQEVAQIMGRSLSSVRNAVHKYVHFRKLTKGDVSITYRKGIPTIMKKFEGKWIPMKKYLWEKHHGSIPEGLLLTYKDGDPSNCKIENLELVTKAEIARRNGRKGALRKKVA